MSPARKRDGIEDAVRLALGPASPDGSSLEVRNRQAAASYLQASTETDDPVARASLRRRALALLDQRVARTRECLAC